MTYKHTILVVDDDPSIRQVISILLQQEGFNVVAAADGVECMQLAYRRQPDLVLLDILMPHKDGREVCRQLREASDVPIIMLSALGDAMEKVGRLKDGADDYIPKPFDNNELVARVRANLRRAEQGRRRSSSVYNDGILFINLEERKVKIKNQPVRLSLKEWLILELLYKNKNQVVTFDQLLSEAWGFGYEKEYQYPKVFIAHLRRKLSDPARSPRYIHTERNIGYRFETHN